MSKMIHISDMTSGFVGIRGDRVYKPNDGFYYKTYASAVRQLGGWNAATDEAVLQEGMEIVEIFISVESCPP